MQNKKIFTTKMKQLFLFGVMYLLYFLIFQISTYENVAAINPPNAFPDHWYELPVDHFNLFDRRTFKMRYLVNNEFYVKGGPLFIEVAGEWTAEPKVLQNGPMAKLAKQHKGVVVTTEHRYYGKSLPFGEDFSVENLKYLQIEQALEDLAQFIEYFKTVILGLENTIVVVHGCSYPGMLVTWLRLRFPNVVDIAYASSAPLGVGLDYPEFYEIVHDTYANVSQNCVDTIKLGFHITNELARTLNGLEILKDALRGWSCGDIEEMGSYQIINTMQQVINVMHDPKDLERLGCSILEHSYDNVFQRFINYVRFKSHTVTCKDPANPSKEDRTNAIAWSYQTCTEMGTFQTIRIDGAKNPFAADMSLEESIADCVKQFGGIVTQQVLETGIYRVNRRYGGKCPKVTKVVTVQGTNDPWRDLAVLENYTAEAPVLIIKGSHCIDVAEKPGDDNELLQVREKVLTIINGWINQLKTNFYSCLNQIKQP